MVSELYQKLFEGLGRHMFLILNNDFAIVSAKYKSNICFQTVPL